MAFLLSHGGRTMLPAPAVPGVGRVHWTPDTRHTETARMRNTVMSQFTVNAEQQYGREQCYPAFEASDDAAKRYASVYRDGENFIAEYCDDVVCIGMENASTLCEALARADRFMVTGLASGRTVRHPTWNVVHNDAHIGPKEPAAETLLLDILNSTPVVPLASSPPMG